MKSIIRLVALVMAALMMLPLAVSCDDSEKEPEESLQTTTGTDAGDNDPVELYDNTYAAAGHELMLNIIDNCYTMRTHWLRGGTAKNETNAPAVWAIGSFLESLSEAYRLYPDDETIKATYIDALDNLLTKYMVQDVNINTPTGRKKVTYYNATRGAQGDYYYDDNAWICIQLLEAYTLLKEDKYLEAAEANLEFLWTGWDDVLGGGIYWDKSYGGKNTCANGPVAIALLRAYQLTEKAEYLERGKAIWDWAQTKLRDGQLYIDSVGKDGGKNSWKAAYNQGVMIYAGAQLYEITGEEEYFNLTKQTYTATISLMFKVTGSRANANVTMSGNPIYKAWCVGWLARGFVKYYTVDKSKNQTAMTYLKAVLDKQIKTKNKDGYYDPYYCTGDWSSESVTDILQPTGVASVFLIAGYFDIVVSKTEN